MIRNVPNAPACTSGQYTGDGSANRAISHGLGVVPALVIIVDETDPDEHFVITEQDSDLIIAFAGVTRAVTAMSTSSFYVGNVADYPTSANQAGDVYDWIAFP